MEVVRETIRATSIEFHTSSLLSGTGPTFFRTTQHDEKCGSYHSESILVVQEELIVRKEILNPIQLVDLLLAALYKL